MLRTGGRLAPSATRDCSIALCTAPHRQHGSATRRMCRESRPYARCHCGKDRPMKVQNHLRTAAAAVLLAASFVLAACGERTNREDFVSLIKGKTEQQVASNAGKPSSVDDQSSSRHVWTYTSRTFDIQRQ